MGDNRNKAEIGAGKGQAAQGREVGAGDFQGVEIHQSRGKMTKWYRYHHTRQGERPFSIFLLGYREANIGQTARNSWLGG